MGKVIGIDLGTTPVPDRPAPGPIPIRPRRARWSTPSTSTIARAESGKEGAICLPAET